MVGETVKSNVQQRIQAVKNFVTNEVNAVKESVELVKQLRPAEAGINLAQDTANGSFEFGRTQARITRSWLG